MRLKDEADLLYPQRPQILTQPFAVINQIAIEPHRAGIRLQNAAHHVKQRALA
jgi:hypothetical protein